MRVPVDEKIRRPEIGNARRLGRRKRSMGRRGATSNPRERVRLARTAGGGVRCRERRREPASDGPSWREPRTALPTATTWSSTPRHATFDFRGITDPESHPVPAIRRQRSASISVTWKNDMPKERRNLIYPYERIDEDVERSSASTPLIDGGSSGRRSGGARLPRRGHLRGRTGGVVGIRSDPRRVGARRCPGRDGPQRPGANGRRRRRLPSDQPPPLGDLVPSGIGRWTGSLDLERDS